MFFFFTTYGIRWSIGMYKVLSPFDLANRFFKLFQTHTAFLRTEWFFYFFFLTLDQVCIYLKNITHTYATEKCAFKFNVLTVPVHVVKGGCFCYTSVDMRMRSVFCASRPIKKRNVFRNVSIPKLNRCRVIDQRRPAFVANTQITAATVFISDRFTVHFISLHLHAQL